VLARLQHRLSRPWRCPARFGAHQHLAHDVLGPRSDGGDGDLSQHIAVEQLDDAAVGQLGHHHVGNPRQRLVVILG
jgi:hypothetical protein